MSSDHPNPAVPAPTQGPGNLPAGSDQAILEAARLELEASRHQIAALEGLLSDLPAIFERKFNERIEPLLERQRLLLDENHALRDRLSRLLPQAGGTGGQSVKEALDPEEPKAEPAAPANEPAETTEAKAPSPAAEPTLPTLPQLRRVRANMSRRSGQNGRVA